ncbi:carbohydrate ABC transporter permease [Cucumibacter marinus]|uniref:carbohydrate ABC transporter permease n=1 Tax=Cucumibacter marinus TaxID=1121252 RepID=UPI000404489F|nr:sugar ABC transporter permease [Cucumibacter marinus]
MNRATASRTVPYGMSKAAARPNRARLMSGLTPYLFIAPGFLLFTLAILYPLVQAFQVSFYDWKIIAGAVSDFVGLENYQRALADPRFWHSLVNSGVYMLFTVPPQIALGLMVAMLLVKKGPAQPLFRVLFYLPVVTSWVVVSLLFKYLFADEGLINYTLGDFLHLSDGETSWLSSRWTAMVAICALGIWKGIGWSMMIFLAALQGVPRDLEEAAILDGANRWQRFLSVTLPAIWAAVIFVAVMLVIGGFNVFTSVLVMTGGGPGGATEVVLTYMYKQAFEYLDFGYGSAIAVLLTVLVFVLSVLQLKFFGNRDGGEK